MHIKDIRRMNLVGTIFFALFGYIMVLGVIGIMIQNLRNYPRGYVYDYYPALRLAIVLFCFFTIFTLLLYRYTVTALDRGNYKVVKWFTLIGIIVGWIGIILPSIAFYKSYKALNNFIDNKKSSASSQ